MILFVDNYDSFTYNLVQYVGEIEPDVKVFRNDKFDPEIIEELKPSHIVISPGPGTPDDAGVSVDVIKRYYKEIPILGVCLGHQSIGAAFGGDIVHAPSIMHGKVSEIIHQEDGIFMHLPIPFKAARYHSLIIDTDSLSDEFQITAQTEDYVIMGIQHKEFPLHGVQFHPESIATDHGKQIIRNFLEE